MGTYDEILRTLECSNPALIYVAIGCAQGHHAPQTQTPQEYPPQIAAWPGTKFIILIDPALESPPVARVPADPPDTTFREIRRCFHWSEPRDTGFLNALCRIALVPGGPHVIVQDYTGVDIRSHLPIQIYGPPLLKKVLYDMTYADAGCFVDFRKVAILRTPGGGFLQPFYLPLTGLRGTPSHLLQEVKSRFQSLAWYGHRFLRIQKGVEERRDWCTPELVAKETTRLFHLYGIPPALQSLPELLTAALYDFCQVAHQPLTTEEAFRIVNGDYVAALTALRAVIEAENQTSASM